MTRFVPLSVFLAFKTLPAAAFLLITIAIRAGGCNHLPSKNDGNTTAISAGSQLSALVGKRITIRGGLFRFKCGPGIELDDEELVCLETVHAKSISEDEDAYREIYDKRVEATGTLRFFHDPTPMDENVPAQRIQDHYYLETETTQVRLVPN